MDADLPAVQPSPRRRSERSHRAILDAAEALLGERSYASITIEEIAARAGVGKATIYRWWSSKAEIFIEIYDRLAPHLSADDDTGSFREDLAAFLRRGFKAVETTVIGLALAGIISEAQTNPVVDRIVRDDFAVRRREAAARIVRRAIERGEIAGSAPIETICNLITSSTWYYILVSSGVQKRKRADEIADIICRGVCRQEPAPECTSRNRTP